ncbi:MAG: HDOD domain-containing protein [Zoogloeaceae bacterium]|nr:HDOD domain-containing protein [Zoogloeaceae bacterium]
MNAEREGFISREPLLGRDQRIVAYEFSHALQSRIAEKRLLVRQFYDDVLLRHLAALDLDGFLEGRLAFLELSPASLSHPAFVQLPRHNIFLSLALTVTDAPLADMALVRALPSLKALRANGTRVGMKWQYAWKMEASGWDALLAEIDFIRISWREFQDDSDDALERLVSLLRPVTRTLTAGTSPLRLVASELRTPEDFRRAYRLGFDLFRGDFINHREPGKISRSSTNRLRILQLLRHLRHDAETSRLTQEIRQDPVLSYRLLRYVNSAALGLNRQIGSLDQALTILGRDTLYRWLSTLLFHVVDPGYYEWALTEQALARAALMERLGKYAGHAGLTRDDLFLAGLFSLLDKLLGEPLEKLATDIQVSDELRAALVHRRGPLAQYLAFAEACETTNTENIAARAQALGLSAQMVNLAIVEALAWAQEMTRFSETAGN